MTCIHIVLVGAVCAFILCFFALHFFEMVFKFSPKISTIFNNYKDAHVGSNLHNDLPLMF